MDIFFILQLLVTVSSQNRVQIEFIALLVAEEHTTIHEFTENLVKFSLAAKIIENGNRIVV